MHGQFFVMVEEIGRCSHVVILLFIDDHVKTHGNDRKSVTENTCQWNQGQKINKIPSAVFDVKYNEEMMRPTETGPRINLSMLPLGFSIAGFHFRRKK